MSAQNADTLVFFVTLIHSCRKEWQYPPWVKFQSAGWGRIHAAPTAWGKRRNLNGSVASDDLDGVVDNKGFTGHEMLDKLDLVHMNGRVYDPNLSKFISADPHITDPLDGQNYNRYSYVLNNPTNLTDPTGFDQCGNASGTNDCKPTRYEVTGSHLKFKTEEAAINAGLASGVYTMVPDGGGKKENSGGAESNSKNKPPGGTSSANTNPSSGDGGSPPPPGRGTPDSLSFKEKMALVPDWANEVLSKGGTRSLTVQHSVIEAFPELEGRTPPGYAVDEKWDTVGYMFFDKKNALVFSLSGKYRDRTDSFMPEMHEVGHGVDYHKRFSATENFRDAWNADRGGMKRYYNYVKSGPGESFAETFSRYYGGDSSLRTSWPNLYNYMKALDKCMAKPGGSC